MRHAQWFGQIDLPSGRAGRLQTDLASGVMSPRFRVPERPPRTLPWQDVRRILQVVHRSEPPGKRDFAMLLLLATYGVGAVESAGVAIGRPGLAGWRSEGTPAENGRAHGATVVAGRSQGIDRVLAVGASCHQGHRSPVPEEEHALRADHHRGESL